MSQQSADRNLLFGVLALQMDFISREQLIAAMQAWAFDKSKPLGQILHDRKVIADDNRTLLDALVKKHLEMHDNDAEKSLASLSSIDSVKTDLLAVADSDVQASVGHMSTGSKTEIDPYATVAPTPQKTGGAGEAPSTLIGRAVSGIRFRILRPHARGGLGEVSVARDQELNREVALKEILGKHADDQESRARFMLEAEITGGLEHPGIVPVYGLGTYGDGRPYYAMRFIRGDSLKDAIDRFHKLDAAGMDIGQRTLELRALLGRFVDVCNAIHYAHCRGVLHRDLKPGNIMLGKYGETLVVDWGLAKPLGPKPGEKESATKLEPGEGSLMPSSSTASETIAGQAVGTPQYMSPEQAAGRLDQLGPGSDVYSLGATLFCVLTGKPPITDKNALDVVQKVQRGEFPKPREVKESVEQPLEAICLKAMSMKIENRYPSARALADDIEHWLADEPVSAWTEPWTIKARRWVSRHTALVTGIASAVGIALIAFVLLFVQQSMATKREAALKDKAEENFQLARGAVKRYLAEVDSNEALKNPGMEPLRLKLLEAAKEYTEKFVEKRRDDPALKVELAVATFQLGQITGELDSETKAIKLHEDAAKMLEALPPEKANETRVDLAVCYHHLGRLNRLADRIPKSEEWYKKALDMWNKLLEEAPKDTRFRDGLARSQMGLGNLYQLLTQAEQARKQYQQAIDIWEDLHKSDNKKESYRRDLAVAKNNMGMTFKRKVGKEEEAKTWFNAAKPLQMQLVKELPDVLQYRNDLAKTEFNLGEHKEAEIEWKRLVAKHKAVTEPHRTLAEVYAEFARITYGSDEKQAEEYGKKSVAMMRQLAERRQNVPSYQGDLARALTALGFAHMKRMKLKEAEVEFAEAVRIQDALAADVGPVLHYQRDLALSYTGLGQAQALNKKKEHASESLQKALALWTFLLKDHDDERDYRQGLYGSGVQFAMLGTPASKPADAVDWYTRTIALADEKYKPVLRLARAPEMARAGKFKDAAKEADALVGQASAASSLVRFAKIYALCAGAANSSGDKAEGDQFAERAMKLLNTAVEEESFRTPANRASLNADADLTALRGRADFKKLLSKLPSE